MVRNRPTQTTATTFGNRRDRRAVRYARTPSPSHCTGDAAGGRRPKQHAVGERAPGSEGRQGSHERRPEATAAGSASGAAAEAKGGTASPALCGGGPRDPDRAHRVRVRGVARKESGPGRPPRGFVGREGGLWNMCSTNTNHREAFRPGPGKPRDRRVEGPLAERGDQRGGPSAREDRDPRPAPGTPRDQDRGPRRAPQRDHLFRTAPVGVLSEHHRRGRPVQPQALVPARSGAPRTGHSDGGCRGWRRRGPAPRRRPRRWVASRAVAKDCRTKHHQHEPRRANARARSFRRLPPQPLFSRFAGRGALSESLRLGRSHETQTLALAQPPVSVSLVGEEFFRRRQEPRQRQQCTGGKQGRRGFRPEILRGPRRPGLEGIRRAPAVPGAGTRPPGSRSGEAARTRRQCRGQRSRAVPEGIPPRHRFALPAQHKLRARPARGHPAGLPPPPALRCQRPGVRVAPGGPAGALRAPPAAEGRQDPELPPHPRTVGPHRDRLCPVRKLAGKRAGIADGRDRPGFGRHGHQQLRVPVPPALRKDTLQHLGGVSRLDRKSNPVGCRKLDRLSSRSIMKTVFGATENHSPSLWHTLK